jgi:hypothetical protein
MPHFAAALTIGVHPISLPFGNTWPSIAGHELSVSRIIVGPAETTAFRVARPLCNNGKDGDTAGSRKSAAVACVRRVDNLWNSVRGHCWLR